jgi:hypothetical protein
MKHKHCDVIKAWADGESIQVKLIKLNCVEWIDTYNPIFDENLEYRIKPVNQEPDWSNSKTGPLELWKNPMYSMQDRLIMADGAIAFLNKINIKQENRIFELIEKIEKIKEIVAKNKVEDV